MRAWFTVSFASIGAAALACVSACGAATHRPEKSNKEDSLDAATDAVVVDSGDGGPRDGGLGDIDANRVDASGDAEIDPCADGRRSICANRMEGIVYTDLSRSALQSRQAIALEFLGRSGSQSRSVFGVGLKLSRCIDGTCRGGDGWQPSVSIYGGYDLTVKPGLAFYAAPTLYIGKHESRRMAISSQVGLSVHMHPFPSYLPGIGVRLYAEPRFPIGRSGRMDVLFGLGIFASVGGPRAALPVPAKKESKGTDISETLSSVIDKELSDVAVGDAVVSRCPMLVLAPAAAPYEVPDGRICLAEMSKSIPPQSCTLLAAVSETGLDTRILDKVTGEVLIEDVSASTWPVVTYCNASDKNQEITFQAWAPNAKSAQDVLASRFDFHIPWGPTGGESASVDADGGLVLSKTKCSLTHIVHGGDHLAVKPGDAPKSTISAPWYMELKLTGDKVSLPKEGDSGLLWSSRAPFDLEATTARAQPETGGPVMFCPQAVSSGADAGASEAGVDTGSDAG